MQISYPALRFSATYDPRPHAQLASQVIELTRRIMELADQLGQLQAATGMSSGTTEHLLATSDGLGDMHTMSGAEIGQVLRAIASDNAKFERLSFTDLNQVDENSFGAVQEGWVLMYKDGYYGMVSLGAVGDFAALGDPGADALLGWDAALSQLSYRTAGSGIVFSAGSIAVDMPTVAASIASLLPAEQYKRFLLAGA